MYVFTQVSLHILIGEGRFHVIDSRHQTGALIHGIAIRDDILQDRTEFAITTGLQPLTDTSIIQITDSQFLVVEQQRNQFMDIVCHQVLIWIDNKTLIFQEG